MTSGTNGTAAARRHARKIGLNHVTAEELTIRRKRAGTGFSYVDGKDKRIADRAILARIRALAIPPAYQDVAIAADPDAHLQAVGRDEAGRIQYRYHPHWEHVRDRQKVDRLARLCKVLPRLRKAVARDLGEPDLSKRKVLATVIKLIDETHIRIGGEGYVESGNSHGAATLLKEHARRRGHELCFAFIGKGGKEIECAVAAPEVLDAVEQMRRLPGERLFQYRADDGEIRTVQAADINDYLREISGAEVTAKDFRTLAASASAAEHLLKLEPGPSERKRRAQLAEVMRAIAETLSNTPAVVRKSYVHPLVVEHFSHGRLAAAVRKLPRRDGMSRGERLVAALLTRRDARVLKLPEVDA